MRAFIAIELPDRIKDSLSLLQGKLKSSEADVKWVEPRNIHLTLKFLGEPDEEKIRQIIAAVDETAKDNPAFKVRLNSIGAFPELQHPRVIWVGMDTGNEESKRIALELEKKTARLGIPKEERTFSSHITIGRIRSALNRERLVQKVGLISQELIQTNLEFDAAKITLFKSTLTSKGPVYEAIKEAALITR